MLLQVDVINVSAAYQNPSPADTCEQYTERSVFALQQQYGGNVTATNATSIQYKGPLTIQVVVYNGSDNSTSKLPLVQQGQLQHAF